MSLLAMTAGRRVLPLLLDEGADRAGPQARALLAAVSRDPGAGPEDRDFPRSPSG